MTDDVILGLDELEEPEVIEYTLQFDDTSFSLTEKMIEKSKLLSSIIELDKSTRDFQMGEKLKKFTTDKKIVEWVIEFLQLETQNEYIKIQKPLPNSYFLNDNNPFNVFINSKSILQLKTLIRIADFMIIPSLVDLACAKMAEQLRNKTKDDIDAIFEDS